MLTTACVDQSIDYSNDNISKKINVDVDGLKLRFGDTERIPMSALIKTGDNLRTDATQLYYIVKEDSSEVNITIAPFRASVNATHMQIKSNIASAISLPDPLPSPGITIAPFVTSEFVPFADGHTLDLAPIDNPDIAELSAVDFEQGTHFSLDLEIRTPNEANNIGRHLAIYEIRNTTVTLPDYIVSPDLDAQHRYHIPHQTFAGGTKRISIHQIRIDGFKFAQALKRGQTPTSSFSIKGEVKVGLQSAVTLTAAPKAHLTLTLRPNGAESAQIKAKSATGIFTPEINQEHKRFEITSTLPKEIEQGKITLQAQRPTISIDLDMQEIPVSAQLHNADVWIIKGDKRERITLAREPIRLTRQARNQVYIYDGSAPYSPHPIASTAQLAELAGLSNLMTTLPEELELGIGGSTLTVAPEESTITFDRSYRAKVRYALYVPFLFGKGFHIDYSGETNPIKLELKDLTDNQLSLNIQADIISTIPIALTAHATPCDSLGQAIPNVSINQVNIPASVDDKPSKAPINLRITSTSKELIKRLHHIKYSVVANTSPEANTTALRSNQYIQITNARLQVSGNITATLRDGIFD